MRARWGCNGSVIDYGKPAIPGRDAKQQHHGTRDGFEVPFLCDHFSLFQMSKKHHADGTEEENDGNVWLMFGSAGTSYLNDFSL